MMTDALCGHQRICTRFGAAHVGLISMVVAGLVMLTCQANIFDQDASCPCRPCRVYLRMKATDAVLAFAESCGGSRPWRSNGSRH